MFLLYSSLTLCLAFLSMTLALLAVRKPGRPWYGSEFMQTYVWAPGFAGAVAVGLIFCFKSLLNFPPSLLEVALAALTVSITAGAYKLLNVRRRLARCTERESAGSVIPFASKTGARSQPDSCDEDHYGRIGKAA